MQKQPQQPLALAFSGGLDTSFCVAKLKDEGWDVHTVFVDTGGIEATGRAGIRKQAEALGAAAHYEIDAKQAVFERFVSVLIRGNVLRGEVYPLSVAAERTQQALSVVEVARKIVNRAADYGIPASDVVVDPLVMPIGAMATAGRQVFALVRRLREELKVNTTCGASNVSFGLPHREGLNAAFLAMAMSHGLTSAITNPLKPEIMQAIMAADVMRGNDQDCARWIATYREPAPEGTEERRRNRRRG